MKLKYFIPIGVACLSAVLYGLSDWLPHEKIIQGLAKIVIITCGLSWVMIDANERKVPVGNWTGVLTLFMQPVGLIIWFIRHWKWRFYKPLLVYMLIWIMVGFLLQFGFVLGGMYSGHSFSSLLDAIGR